MLSALLIFALAGREAHAEAAAPTGVVVDRVVAVVNDKAVTLSEVYAFKDFIEQSAAQGQRAEAERQVMELLIQRLLVNQEVDRLKLDVTDQDLDREIDAVARQNGMDRDSLRAAILQQGMTWETYRTELAQNIRERNFAQYVLRPRITISPDELKDRYRRDHPDAGGVASEVARVQAIFLSYPAGADDSARASVLAKANDLRKQAIGGADFAALSTANDQAGFGAQGGEMGRFKRGDLNEVLDRALAATTTGSISEPVVLPQGVFLLKIVDRSAGDDGFEAAKEEVMNEVFTDRLEKEQQRWFEQARRAAVVKILVDADVAQQAPLPSGMAPDAPAEGPPTEAPAEGQH